MVAHDMRIDRGPTVLDRGCGPGVDRLRQLSAERFFASVSLFVTLAEKPGS